ncbi:MAG TPA: ATP-binding protein [Methylomirabilota bacterium]|jgi:signal transduction histidine kinase
MAARRRTRRTLKPAGGRSDEAATTAHAREAELLLAISRTIVSTVDFREALRRVCRELTRLTGAGTGSVYLVDPSGALLVPQAAYHVPKEHLAVLATTSLPLTEQGFHPPVWRARQPVYSADVARDPRFGHHLFRAVPHQSGLMLPLILDGEVAGAFYLVWWTARRRFERGELERLGHVSGQVTLLLRNARLYAEAQRQRAQVLQILESTSDGIVFLTPDGRVRSANRRAAELFGIAAGQADFPLAELLTREFPDPAENDQAAAVFRTLLKHTNQGGEGDLTLPVRRRVLHWVAQPTIDPDGRPIGLTLTLQDMTREREVSRMKSDFVAFVTHQLRTPLAGIRWMLELAAQEGTDPQEAASYLRDAGESVLRLSALVNHLLEGSRLESGRLTIEPQRIALLALTRQVLNELAPLAREKGHRVVVEDSPEDPAVPGDPRLLRQALLNLVVNAIKYTPHGGEIVISLGRRGEVVQWAIRDNGVGIPKAAQARLFEKFYRADNVLAIETEGTGLGLYLVRLIVEHLGGRVWCESEEGHGARFAFELPLS